MKLILTISLMFLCFVSSTIAQEYTGWPSSEESNKDSELAICLYPEQTVYLPGGVILIESPGQQALIFVATRVQADSAQVAADMKRGFRRDVTLVTIRVSVLMASVDSLVLHSGYTYGVRRGAQHIKAMGLNKTINVKPGQTGYSYIIFPKMEFKPEDVFYITFPGKEYRP